MRYGGASWHRPYGSRGGDEEALGFGQGDGSVSGELDGTISWANYPRRRQDGVWTPNLRGVITTPDGDQLLVSIHGQSVEEQAGDVHRRAILARVELTSQGEPYRWLNTCFLVGEGEIDERQRGVVARHVCLRRRSGAGPASARSGAGRAVPPDRRRLGMRGIRAEYA
jgi:hypothetical protein